MGPGGVAGAAREMRRVARVARILAVVAYGLSLGAGFAVCDRLGVPGAQARRQRWTRAFMARLSAALPFAVRVEGQLPREPMLWVSNHVSWTDIAVLGQLAPLSFLSKAEVRGWPVAGWLAQQAGTLFIRRGAHDSQRLRRDMALRLTAGHGLVIFPEGTTTDGRTLRTFHGRLLACAADAGVAVQPVALRYVRHGEVDPIAPFIGDDDLLSHLLRLLRGDISEVQVQLLAPIDTRGLERAALAYQAQEAVRTALFGSTAAAGAHGSEPGDARAGTTAGASLVASTTA